MTMNYKKLFKIIQFCNTTIWEAEDLPTNPLLVDVEYRLNQVYRYLKDGSYYFEDWEKNKRPNVIKCNEYIDYLDECRVHFGLKYWDGTTVGDIVMEYAAKNGYKTRS